MTDKLRIDKWLWAARFFKTRSLASQAITLGRVLHNQQKIKAAHLLKTGDFLQIHQGEQIFLVEVLLLSEQRNSASVAQTMYQETAESQIKRTLAAQQRQLFQEPAALAKRPNKRERRQLERIQN